MHIKKILCPTDFSERSLQALHYATGFAQAMNAELLMLHVTQPNVALINDAVPYVPIDPELIPQCKSQLSAYVKANVPAGITTAEQVEVGDAAGQIVLQAEVCGADLIVIGSHGRTGFQRLVLGSTAESVVRHAHCPVLVVKDAQKVLIAEQK
ncbi:MAG: universal stress protein [Rhizobacter sp.]|nr:universal stress protein [Chlorobiales bacterium]